MSVAIAIGVGILLIALETILPGMIAGACGTILMGIGVWLAYCDYGSAIGTYVLIGSLFALLAFGVVWVIYLPNSFFAKMFISNRSIQGDAGEELPNDLEGKEGVALTRLYSCGKIKIGDTIYDAITAGEGIEQGAKIRILHVEGFKIVVEEIGTSSGKNK